MRCPQPDDIGPERDEFSRVFANVVGIPGRPAGLEAHVAALDPARLLQPLRKLRQRGLELLICGGLAQQHADGAHTLALLRARRERPPGGSAAEQRDERAPVHSPMPPVLPTERIAHLSFGRRLLRCGISIRPMSAQGQFRPTRSKRDVPVCPLRPESGLHKSRCDPPLRAISSCEQSQQSSAASCQSRPNELRQKAWLFD
jgi:hypothetical protein